MIGINHDTNLGGISFLTTKNTERRHEGTALGAHNLLQSAGNL